MTKTAKRTKLIPKVTSLMDLRNQAKTDIRYLELAIIAAENLGGSIRKGSGDVSEWHPDRQARALLDAMTCLNDNANETDSEKGVVAEVNFVRDLVTAPAPKKTAAAIINIDLVRDPILSTWSVIASDAMALGDMTNAGAIEMCIDADRMTFYAIGAKGKTAAEVADKELDRAIKAHGYKKVLNSLSLAIRLL